MGAEGAKLRIKVRRVTGHGPHGLFPSEEAWVRVEVPGANPSTAQTDLGVKDHSALCWEGEELEFDLGPDSKEVRVQLQGQLEHRVDIIGAGSCNLTKTFGSPRDPSPQDVKVPLEASGGRMAGELELTLDYS